MATKLVRCTMNDNERCGSDDTSHSSSKVIVLLHYIEAVAEQQHR